MKDILTLADLKNGENDGAARSSRRFRRSGGAFAFADDAKCRAREVWIGDALRGVSDCAGGTGGSAGAGARPANLSGSISRFRTRSPRRDWSMSWMISRARLARSNGDVARWEIARVEHGRARFCARDPERVFGRSARFARALVRRGRRGARDRVAMRGGRLRAPGVGNRDLEKARQLVAELKSSFSDARVAAPVARLEAVPWEERALRFQIANVDLVVNATPLGMRRSDPVAAVRRRCSRRI